MKFELRSPSWQDKQEIPRDFTCEGENVSPELEWSGAPAGTQAFALIMQDPDAPSGTFTHWVLYNLPGETRRLPQGVPEGAKVADRGLQARNDFGKSGYGGPCPPPGKPHRYFFKLYALKDPLPLEAGAGKDQVEDSVQSRVLGTAELMGTFRR